MSLELRLPSAANEAEARALSMFVELRTFFAYAALRDVAGAWQAVLRLLDEGHHRDEVLEQINDVLGEHVLEPMTAGAEIDVERVHAAFDRLGRWDALDDEHEHLPWMIDEWRFGGVHHLPDPKISGGVLEDLTWKLQSALHPRARATTNGVVSL